MIVEYHRPQTIEEALVLLARKEPVTLPLGGGTSLNRRKSIAGGQSVAVVDLQKLGLNQVERLGNFLSVGATVTLQELSEMADLPAALKDAARKETNFNLRQVATLAGTLVSVGGRSPLATLLLAMDAKIVWTPGDEEVGLGDWLLTRQEYRPGKLITRIQIPLLPKVAYQAVSRTPTDWPLVCVAMARWASGRTRIALGGYGSAPSMAMDGPEASGIVETAKSACENAGDEWASATYRQEMAGLLAQRCIEQIEAL